jgi:hypothetical protein
VSQAMLEGRRDASTEIARYFQDAAVVARFITTVRTQKPLFSTCVVSLGLLAGACVSSTDGSTGGTPVIMPPIQATAVANGSDSFAVTLTVAFADTVDTATTCLLTGSGATGTGGCVDAYTFTTTDLSTVIDHQNVAISPNPGTAPSAYGEQSPAVIDETIPVIFGATSGQTVNFNLALFGITTGESAVVAGSITLPALGSGSAAL